MDELPETWHHGLMARWWAEFREPEEAELAYYKGAIELYGQPALDLACGTGRLLLPLLDAGLDVDGVDVSGDMLAQAQRIAVARGISPTLTRQAMHALDLPRRYRTIFICDSFGLGGGRAEALQTLLRAWEHLEAGGVLLLSHELPYASDVDEWLRWLPGRSADPEPWPSAGERRRTASGDELELVYRERSFDPLLQQTILEVRGRLWRGGQPVEEDEHAILLPAFFAQEVLLMLGIAGFVDVEIQGRYNGIQATADDTTVVFVARRPA
jgi:SAM-dependent methyltransferase